MLAAQISLPRSGLPRAWNPVRLQQGRTAQQLRAAATCGGYTERVLRYPGGLERRIRYPNANSKALQELSDAEGGFYRSFSETEQPDRWGPPDWDVLEMWADSGEHPQNAGPAAASIAPAEQHQQAEQEAGALDSLFAQVEGAAYQEAQRRFWERIGSSYEVLESCPWPLPRPLHVLAVPQLTSASSAMFTLHTRLHQRSAEDELSKVLGRQRRDGAPLVAVHRRAPGVVAFSSEAAAERFGAALEAEGHDGVALATVDSHQLFRLTGECATVVVLVGDGADIEVSPGELEASLCARGDGF